MPLGRKKRKQPIYIFVRAALPWTVNVCKINWSLECCLQFPKFCKFRFVVKNYSFGMDSFFIKSLFYSVMNFLRWNWITPFVSRKRLFLSTKVTMQRFPEVVHIVSPSQSFKRSRYFASSGKSWIVLSGCIVQYRLLCPYSVFPVFSNAIEQRFSEYAGFYSCGGFNTPTLAS